MSALSPENISAIERNLLGDSLNPLQPLLREADELGRQDDINDNSLQTISRLLVTLLGQPAALELRVGSENRDIASDLASVFRRVRAGHFNYKNFAELVRLAVEKAADIEIWRAVIHLIDSFTKLTPPTSINQSFHSTPRTYSSASHQGSEQTKNILEPALRQELWDCTYKDVDEFFQKHFEGRSWAAESERRYDGMKSGYANGRWTDFPTTPTELAVWQWWSAIQAKYLTEARGIYYTTKSKTELTGSNSERQLDLLIKHRDAPSKGQHDWADVRVVGEHQLSRADPSSKFFQLARYTRDVFIAQPMRRFIHGFLLLETSMELYIFDRSGAYGAKPFNIHEDPARFAKVMLGYVLMSDEELGLDTFIEREGDRIFVSLTDGHDKAKRRLELETTPIIRPHAIVCRGTCCYRTIDKQIVVKFSWGSDRRLPEAEYLRRARDRGVKGVARLSGDTIVTNVAELREGLTFSKKRRFRDPSRTFTSSYSQSQSQSSATRSGVKDLKIQRDNKRASVDRGSRWSKKSRSNSQTSELSHEYKGNKSQGVGNQGKQEMQGADEQAERFRNRVLSCLAITPAGRSLKNYRSILELLRCFRDAIKAHQSLFIDGKILHRDISLNNIIITKPEDADGFSGMLIDMDLATSVDERGRNERSRAQKMTGTLKYMAIEIVELAFRDARHDLNHTYRHDLESFFYVFLDICINCGWEGRHSQRPDPLRGWYIGSYKDIVATKSGGMGKGKFAGLILSEFAPVFESLKSVAIALRDALFQQGDIYTGTQADPLPLYEGMIRAFDDALEDTQL